MNTPVYNVVLLDTRQREFILNMAKGMANHWSKIIICWYSDGSIAYQCVGVSGEVFPTVIIE